MKFSVIVTVKNEAENISELLDSLLLQQVESEIVVVDAQSTDGTASIVQQYASEHENVRLIVRRAKRGLGRNIGMQNASGDAFAFIDGDCIADQAWLKSMARSLSEFPVVAGKIIYRGRREYISLERVELYRQGMDVTFPSSNLAYRREVVEDIGMFDDWFITAEDIDLNIRAVDRGYAIHYDPEAIVYHKTRENFYTFVKQAFWNGAGRKQLTLKHGRLWKSYRPLELFRRKPSFYGAVRTASALMGYAGYKLYGSRRS